MACFSALLSSTAQDAALEIDNLRANYQTILDRNPFNLQPPPPPEPEAEEEPEATPIFDAAEPEESETDEEESRMIDLPFRLFDD